jgi:hypothetical protein
LASDWHHTGYFNPMPIKCRHDWSDDVFARTSLIFPVTST